VVMWTWRRHEREQHAREPICLSIVRVRKKLDLHRFIAKSVFTKQSDCLIKAISGRSVLVEEITCEKNEIDL
jgi:hypothetical protein